MNLIPNQLTKTPLKAHVFAHYLSSHSDHNYANEVIHILLYGAHLGYCGPRVARLSPNSFSVKKHKKLIADTIQAEITAGHTCGPFDYSPFTDLICSPLFVIPKKNSSKFRAILNLSSPVGSSVNDYIDKDCFSMHYSRIDDAIFHLTQLGKGALMSKLDIKSAFRLIPVHPCDWPLLGYCIDNKFYYDTVLPFGLRSSPYLFCLISDAILWIFSHLNNHYHALCYMDDFLICALPTAGNCQLLMDSFISLCSCLGVPLAEDKTEGPSSSITFLGVLLDSVTQTISLPQSKFTALSELLMIWSEKESCTRLELQSLIGHLMFASKCIPSSRLFTRRLILLLSDFQPSVDFMVIAGEFRKDIDWWIKFLPLWNGAASFIKPHWLSSSTINLFTDASATLGCGAFFNGAWFSLRWPDWLLLANFSIEFLELVPIAFACHVWHKSFSTQRISFQCDNLGAVQAFNKLGSSSRSVLHLLRDIVSSCARYNFTIRLFHLPGIDNDIADSLSRAEFSRFRSLAPSADYYPVTLPDLFSSLRSVYMQEQWT